MSTQDGGWAFPQENQIPNDLHERFGTDRGMTLRDYFAAEALTECIRVADHQTPPGGAPRLSMLFEKAATYAYFAADAMLKARNG